MRIKQHENAWYYSTGLLTEHTQAIYHPKENQLVIVKLKHLPKILKHLEQTLGISEITLKWYKEATND